MKKLLQLILMLDARRVAGLDRRGGREMLNCLFLLSVKRKKRQNPNFTLKSNYLEALR